MTDESDNSLASLGTLSTQLLGVVAVLAQELVRAQVVDAARLQQGLEAFWQQERGAPGATDADRRMIDAVQRVVGAAIAAGGSDGQGS